MEVSEYLVGSPAFKAGGAGDPRTAGSIPVHLRYLAPQAGSGRFAPSTRSADRKRLFARDGGATRATGVQRPACGTQAPFRPGWRSHPGYRWPSTRSADRKRFFTRDFLRSLVGALVLVLLFASPVGGQARLLESVPEDGANLGVLETVRFEFDGLLLIEGAEIAITRTNGQAFPVTDLAVEGSVLSARPGSELTSGDYEIGYSVRSSDGALNEGTIRIGVAAPSQALSGGLLAVIGVFAALTAVIFFVFYADKRRRPGRS